MDSGIASFCCSLFVSAALLRYLLSFTEIQSTPYTIQFSYLSYVQSCASVTLLSFLNICISPGRKLASLSCQSVCFKKKKKKKTSSRNYAAHYNKPSYLKRYSVILKIDLVVIVNITTCYSVVCMVVKCSISQEG